MTMPIDMPSVTTERFFNIERPQFGEQVVDARRCFNDLREQANAICVNAESFEIKTSRILALLFKDRRFKFSWSNRAEDFTLSGTLLNQRGNCLGLTTLFVLLARDIDCPVQPILFEGHIAAVIQQCGKSRHIELSRGGAFVPERWTERLHGPRSGRLLAVEELLAVQLSNRATFVLIPRGQQNAAHAMLDQALSLFPDYCGGRLNRAMLLLQMGKVTEASNELEQIFALAPGRRFANIAVHLEREIILAIVQQFKQQLGGQHLYKTQ